MNAVDMLVFAFDLQAPVTVVIITGDRDFTYAISTLRMRGHRVVLIMPNAKTPSHLKDNVDISVSWKDVLEWPGQIASPARPLLLCNAAEDPLARLRVARPNIALPAYTKPLQSAMSEFSEIVEDGEIVMIPRGLGTVETGTKSSSINGGISAVGIAAVISTNPSQSEWLLVEQDNGDIEEVKEELEDPVELNIEDEDLISVAENAVEGDFLNIFRDVRSDNKADTLPSSSEIDRTPMLNNSTSTSAPFVEKEDISVPLDVLSTDKSSNDTNEVVPESFIFPSVSSGALRPEAPCFASQLGGCRKSGSPSESSSARQVTSASIAPVTATTAFAVPKTFKMLVAVLQKGKYFGGNAVRFVDLACRLRMAEPEYDKGHGGPKKYVQKARDLGVVDLFGDEDKSDFSVKLSRRVTDSTLMSAPAQPAASNLQIAGKFVVLVDILQLLRKKGDIRPTFTAVGTLILKRDPEVYGRAGCTKLKKYVELAREAKLVNVGPDWVELKA